MIMAGLGALIARRFYRALTRKPAKARAKRARVGRADDAQVRPVALPSGRGWIVRELGWEAAADLPDAGRVRRGDTENCAENDGGTGAAGVGGASAGDWGEVGGT